MLFDLRGRGRRRTVRTIYTGLALLMGIGLIGFGVGGGLGGGGILSSISKEGESGGGNGYAKQIAKYRKLTKREPKNVSAWENLTKNLFHEAGQEPFVTNTGAVTSKGRELFRQTSEAWQSYIALNPPTPNIELAQLMENVYSEAGLNEPDKEVEVLQIAVAAKPKDGALYAQLAAYAYRAHNTRLGDLSTEKAVASYSNPTQRLRVKNELAEIKKNPTGEKTYTTTTNGKTYVGKLNAKGELIAKEVLTTPSKSSSGTKTK